MENAEHRKKLLGSLVILALIAGMGFFFYKLSPADGAGKTAPAVFEIQKGDGFRQIVSNLAAQHLIRSKLAFEVLALLGGRAFGIHPGLYRVSAAMTGPEILRTISVASASEVTVTIPEGSNIYNIDKILSGALVIKTGALVAFNNGKNLEGTLFPDTYNFFTNAPVEDVVKELTDNFALKAKPLLDADPKNFAENLTIASIIEKEVPDPTDQSIVAGIILKRMAANMTLNIDATVCYAKFQAHPTSSASCYPLSALDFKIDSPYNSYLNRGLPPGPIGNPGTMAITAALHPQRSPYWYYLSDPKTGKTIFAKTLDEQTQNRVKYLVR